MDKLRENIQRHGLVIAIYMILVLTVSNSTFTFYSRYVIITSSETQDLVLRATRGLETLGTNINLADMGLRGYMLIPDPKLLDPCMSALNGYQANLDELRNVLTILDFDIKQMDLPENAIQQYMVLIDKMIKLTDNGNVQEAIEILRSDPGYDAWLLYSPFVRSATSYINELSARSEMAFSSITNKMILAQIIFLLLGPAVMISAIISLRRAAKNRWKLFANLQTSIRKFIFNPGTDDANEEEQIIDNLIFNLEKTTGFINHITDGNYEVKWEGLSDRNKTLNQENIAGKLITMRDQMKKVKTEDEIRLWTSAGLTEFAAIIRNNQHDFNILAEKIISYLVKYLDIQLGGLFIVDDEEDEKHLELVSCFAYERVKYLEKKVAAGTGLIGQCYLEGETIHMTNVPQDFQQITSGLGDTRPDSVLIVPLKFNAVIEGVIELASLQPFEPHQIEFVERLGEALASALNSVRSSQNMRLLLERTQQQAEEIRAQEEEMRQNMEELQATQEQMERKTQEIEQLLQKAAENEQTYLKQQEILQEEMNKLENEEAILNTLMQVLPERITIKDEKGRYLKLSESKYNTLRQQGITDILGKTDKEVFGEEHFLKSYKAEQDLMKNKTPILNIEEKIQEIPGNYIWGLTSRLPFRSSKGKILGTIAVTQDVSGEKKLREEMEELREKLG